MMVSFCAVLFPLDVLDEILNLIESVSEGFPSYSSLCDFENEVKVTKIKSTFKLIPMIYPCKFGDIPSIGSRDIVDTRICHADADAETLTVLGLLCP